MPQVPYNPIMGQGPGNIPIPYRSDRGVSETAFGAGIGQAEESFGKQLERSASVVESNVLQAQQLKNEADVNTAVTDYIQNSGELTNKFRQLPGSQAQDQLQAHTKDLQDLREKIRGNLTNPMAQKMFDRETMHRFALDIVQSSQYSATQMRQYTKQAISDKMDATEQEAIRNVRNGVPGALKKAADSLREDEQKLGHLEGDTSPEALARRERLRLTKLVDKVTSATSTVDPPRAKAIFEQAVKAKAIDEGQVDVIQNRLDEHTVRFYSTMDAGEITANRIQSDPTAFINNPEAARTLMRQDVEKKAVERFPNEPLRQQQYVDQTMNNISNKSNLAQKEQTERTTELNKAVMGLAEATMSNGRKPISMQEMNSLNPKAQDFYEEAIRRDPRMALRLENAFKANSKEDNILRPDQIIEQERRWAGMKNEDKQNVDVNKLFNAGVIDNKLRARWAEEQNKMTSAATNTNDADYILKHYKATLNDQRIFESKSDTEANSKYEHLRGALQLKIESEQRESGRPVKAWTPEEERRVMNQMIEETNTGEKHWWGTEITEPRYEVMYKKMINPPMPDWVKSVAPDAKWDVGAGEWRTTLPDGRLVRVKKPVQEEAKK